MDSCGVVAESPPSSAGVIDGVNQVNLVFGGTIPFEPLVGVILNGTPLHVAVVMVLITALAFTNMVAVNAVPAQSTPPAL